MVYPESRYISMIDKTAGRLGVLKLHLNNTSRSRFDGNENRTFFLAETKITFLLEMTALN